MTSEFGGQLPKSLLTTYDDLKTSGVETRREGEAPAEPRFSNAVVFEFRSRSGRDSDCLAIATTLQPRARQEVGSTGASSSPVFNQFPTNRLDHKGGRILRHISPRCDFFKPL